MAASSPASASSCPCLPPAGCSVLRSVGGAARQSDRNYRTHSSLTALRPQHGPRGAPRNSGSCSYYSERKLCHDSNREKRGR